VIVPLFALASAGIAIDGDFLGRAARRPITLGVLVGYAVGKPVGIVGTALLITWLSRGRLRPTAGWGAVAGAGASAGVGFTVSLLVATLAFRPTRARRAALHRGTAYDIDTLSRPVRAAGARAKLAAS
jgi:Na+/H+ antiporter NhaA